MQRYCGDAIRKHSTVVSYLAVGFGCCLGACSASVYPASECKPPPPPLTVPNSPRSQCREVSTEHAKDWPQQYKDIQYLEENAVYWVRMAYSELTESTQKQLHSEFTQAVVDINNADGRYLQLVDAAVAAQGSDFTETTKDLAKALEVFVNFIDANLKGAQITSSARKDVDKAKAIFRELNLKVQPPKAPDDTPKPNDEGKSPDEKTEDTDDNIVKT